MQTFRRYRPGLFLALLAVLSLLSFQACGAAAGGQTTSSHTSSDALAQVKTFYTAYLAAVKSDSHTDPNIAQANAVRQKYVLPATNARLTKWGDEHEADPFLNAQSDPASWSAALGDSKAGYATVVITEQYEGGPNGVAKVKYIVQLSDLMISDVQDS
ncbi:MAG: hypothetical protein ACREP9_23200 [Candidatus Dormibacteraceae bacterium]